MPDIDQELVTDLRSRLGQLRQELEDAAADTQAELANMKQTCRWVTVASGVLALAAGFGLGCALAPGRDA